MSGAAFTADGCASCGRFGTPARVICGAGATGFGVNASRFVLVVVRAIAAAGGAGRSVHATIFGSATSWFSFTSFGEMIVWCLLSAFGRIEMISCFAYSGSARLLTFAGSALGCGLSGGRYSETL